jgi:hypothetical protein
MESIRIAIARQQLPHRAPLGRNLFRLGSDNHLRAIVERAESRSPVRDLSRASCQ